MAIARSVEEAGHVQVRMCASERSTQRGTLLGTLIGTLTGRFIGTTPKHALLQRPEPKLYA